MKSNSNSACFLFRKMVNRMHPKCPVLRSPPQSMGIPFPDSKSVLFEIEIPCILLFLTQNRNSWNSPKIMHPKTQSESIALLRTWAIECRKTKTKVITPTNHIKWTNQNSKRIHVTGVKRGKTCASEVRLVLLLIG